MRVTLRNKRWERKIGKEKRGLESKEEKNEDRESKGDIRKGKSGVGKKGDAAGRGKIGELRRQEKMKIER